MRRRLLALLLRPVVGVRGCPAPIAVDNGTEFTSKALDVKAFGPWSTRYGSTSSDPAVP
jgi:hypothetical protein